MLFRSPWNAALIHVADASDHELLARPQVMHRENAFASGDGWIVVKEDHRFTLSYLTGYFATEEKVLEISAEEARRLRSGGVDFDKFIVNR